MEIRERVTDEGYSLAPFLLRLSAASVDAALFLLSTLLIFFLLYPLGSYHSLDYVLGIQSEYSLLTDYQGRSTLFVETDGSYDTLDSTDYKEYEAKIYSYYFVFNASDNANNPHPEGYSIADYNQQVYGLPTSSEYVNTSTFYDFATKEDGSADTGKLGVLKSSLFNSDGSLTDSSNTRLLSYYKTEYSSTCELFYAEPYYSSVQKEIANDLLVIECIAVFVPATIFYFIIPMFSRYNRTLGKKWMKLAVIDVNGTPLNKWFLSLRFLPFAITAIFALILDSIIYSTSLVVLLFLISFGLTVFTPKGRALHDYCAHSVVTREEDGLLKPKKEASNAENN